MVARIKSGRSIGGMLRYNEDKVAQGSASLILASGFAMELGDMNRMQRLERFHQRTLLNPSVGTNAIHITLNFDREDKLDDASLQAIAVDYMARIGFAEQPFLVYRHRDAAHEHVHIATTNIRAEYGRKETKRSITNIVGAVLERYSFTSLAEFNAILRQFNVRAERGGEDTQMYRKKGLLYTLTDSDGRAVGVPIKASAIYGSPTLANIEKRYARGAEKRRAFRQPLRQAIDKVELLPLSGDIL